MVHRTIPEEAGYSRSEPSYDEYETQPGLGLTEASGEDVESRVVQARERLDQLRQEQERVTLEERRLKHLRTQQEEFLAGSRETNDHLKRAVAKLERDGVELERQLEGVAVARETLGRHLERVGHLAPEHWNEDTIEQELDQALAVLDEADADIERCDARLSALGAGALGASSHSATSMLPDGMSPATLLRVGFFLSLPFLAGLGLLGIIFGFLTR